MKNRNVIYLLILFIILSFDEIWSSISIAKIRKFEEIVKESDLIVDAVVKDIKYYFDHDVIGYAMITLSVKEVIKGECPDEILLRRCGVDKNNKFTETHLIREYSLDKRYVLCLIKHSKEFYMVLGLIDGTFEVEKNGSIAKIGVSNDDFKQNIKNILSGNKDKFNIKSSISNKEASLQKENNNNMITSSGTHFDGKFITNNITWNTNYFPVKFYYNPILEPESVRLIREQVFDRINDAFTV